MPIVIAVLGIWALFAWYPTTAFLATAGAVVFVCCFEKGGKK